MLLEQEDKKERRKLGLALLRKIEEEEETENLSNVQEDDPRLVQVRELLLDPSEKIVQADMRPIEEKIILISRQQKIPRKSVYIELAKICGSSYRTIYQKVIRNRSILLGDLKAITNYLDIPMEEVLPDDD